MSSRSSFFFISFQFLSLFFSFSLFTKFLLPFFFSFSPQFGLPNFIIFNCFYFLLHIGVRTSRAANHDQNCKTTRQIINSSVETAKAGGISQRKRLFLFLFLFFVLRLSFFTLHLLFLFYISYPRYHVLHLFDMFSFSCALLYFRFFLFSLY